MPHVYVFTRIETRELKLRRLAGGNRLRGLSLAGVEGREYPPTGGFRDNSEQTLPPLRLAGPPPWQTGMRAQKNPHVGEMRLDACLMISGGKCPHCGSRVVIELWKINISDSVGTDEQKRRFDVWNQND